MVTREAFFARPNYWYYSGEAIPDEWIAAEFVREASKNGDLYFVEPSLAALAGVLPLARMVEVYERVRARSPDRESEFRPAFERVFGERMVAFPAPLQPSPVEGLSYLDGDGGIPF